MNNNLSSTDMQLPPVETADFVDLERYDGLWYEVARTPNLFEIACTCVTATYGIIDETSISVFNSCNKFLPNGPLITAEGIGVVTNPETNAELEIFFEGSPVGEEYWILDVVEDPSDPEGDYTYAVIGDSDRDFLFILARTPNPDPEILEEIYAGLEEQFYDTDELIVTRQPSRCNCDETDEQKTQISQNQLLTQVMSSASASNGQDFLADSFFSSVANDFTASEMTAVYL